MYVFILVILLSVLCVGIAFLIGNIVEKVVEQPLPTSNELLISACFDDKKKATKLIEREKQKDRHITDEEAASRALEKLLVRAAFKEQTQIDFYL